MGSIRAVINLGLCRIPRLLPFFILAVCALTTPVLADAPIFINNLILNGSFESPSVSGASACGAYFDCLGYNVGDNVGGWSVFGQGGASGAAILQLGSTYTEPDIGNGGTLNFHAQNGTQSLDLTGVGNQGLNGIKQSVSTIPGAQYTLSFDLGHQDGSAPGFAGPSSLNLFIDGAVVNNFANPNTTPEDVNWEQFAYTFTAPTNLTTIAFANSTPLGNNYAGLDNVIVSVTPSPSPTAPPSCGQIINHSIPEPKPGGSPYIFAAFTPQITGLSLTDAAADCGFTTFDWMQTVTSVPDPVPTGQCSDDIICLHTSPLTAPFNDPPLNGYPYCFLTYCGDNFPFYYDALTLDSTCAEFTGSGFSRHCNLPVISGNTLNFFDSPSDPCLLNADGTPSLAWQFNPSVALACGFSTALAGSEEEFRTRLIGILSNFQPGTDCLTVVPATCVDLGIGFSWVDNYNGTTGGISVIDSNTPVDPDSGTGGITITSFTDVTRFQQVPEPPSILLMSAGILLIGMVAGRRSICLSANHFWRSFAHVSSTHPVGSAKGTILRLSDCLSGRPRGKHVLKLDT